jgi:hypothetical protein
VPPGPGPSPTPPGPGPSPVPPGPGPFPVPPGPGPSPVPGPPGPGPIPGPQPVFPPPQMASGAPTYTSGLPTYTVPPISGTDLPTARPTASASSTNTPTGNASSTYGESAAHQPGADQLTAPRPTTAPRSTQYGTPVQSESETSTPYGVGGASSSDRPFGGFASPYGQPAPHQRGVYGGEQENIDATMAVPTGFGASEMTMPVPDYGSIDMTMPVSTNPVENSGSLTGHILAQGWREEVTDRRRNNIKVAIAMLVVLGLLVTVSLVFLLTAGNAFGGALKGIFH